MNVLFQRHCSSFIYVIPHGLKELLNDISREVIRFNPEDICTFIADYLDALLVTRENARVAAKLVVSLTEMAQSAVQFLAETELDQEQINLVLDAIKQTFEESLVQSQKMDEEAVISKVLKKSSISPETAEIAARIIQQAFRRFRERKSREDALLAGIIDWRVAAKSALKLYRRCGVSNEEAHRAATLIKAAYKGYYTRRMMRALKQRLKTKEEVKPLPEPDQNSCLSHNRTSKTKFVKINFDSIIPHVNFDTNEEYIEIVDDILNTSEIQASKIVVEQPFESGDANRMINDIIEKFESDKNMDEALMKKLERQTSEASKSGAATCKMDDITENFETDKEGDEVVVKELAKQTSKNNESGAATRTIDDKLENFETDKEDDRFVVKELERQSSKSSTVVRHVMDAIFQHVYDILD